MKNQSQSHLLPVHPELSLGERLLFDGASSELLNQALDLGLLDGANLNLVVDGSPLIEHWVRKKHYEIPLTELAVKMGVEPSLDWPVETEPSQIQLPLKDGWTGSSAWMEHALVRLVKKGMDPLVLWKKEPGNLLEWAVDRDHPWLLKACLEALSPESRQLEVQRNLVKDVSVGREDLEVPANRLHFAMSHETPLVAEVWHSYGVPLNEPTSHGETPLFFATSASTLKWALSKGADPTVVNVDGILPMEMWRHHTRDVERWKAMQACMGSSVEQSLGFVRSAVTNADLDALKKAFELINDPAATFRDGKTVLEYVAEQALLANDNFSRNKYRHMALSKMLAFLWPRTDLSVAQAAVRPHGLTGLQVAWLGSVLSAKVAARAANLATAKVDFQEPRLASVARWSREFFEPEVGQGIAACEKAVRFWVLEQCQEEWRAKSPDVDKGLDAIEALLKNVDYSSVALSESVWLARALAFPVVKIRDTNQLTDEQAERVAGLVLRGMAVQAEADQNPSENLWKLSDYEAKFLDLMEYLGVHERGIETLAAMVAGLTGMGVRPSREEFADMLDGLLESSHVIYHPAVSPVLPVIRQEILSQRWEGESVVAKNSSSKQRL